LINTTTQQASTSTQNNVKINKHVLHTTCSHKMIQISNRQPFYRTKEQSTSSQVSIVSFSAQRCYTYRNISKSCKINRFYFTN